MAEKPIDFLKFKAERDAAKNADKEKRDKSPEGSSEKKNKSKIAGIEGLFPDSEDDTEYLLNMFALSTFISSNVIPNSSVENYRPTISEYSDKQLISYVKNSDDRKWRRRPAFYKAVFQEIQKRKLK